jgi:hypothetical protein
MTEIASWLKIWDQIATAEYKATSTTETTTSLFSPPWRSSSSTKSSSSNMQGPPGWF